MRDQILLGILKVCGTAFVVAVTTLTVVGTGKLVSMIIGG